MKTVSVTAISSKPTSVPKAARVLSNFVSSENGASQAVSAYLRRASESFEELSTLHRELRNFRSTHKHGDPRSEAIRNPRIEGRASEDRDYCRDHGGGGEVVAKREKHSITKMTMEREAKLDGGRLEAEEENGRRKKVGESEEAHQNLTKEKRASQKERDGKVSRKRKIGVEQDQKGKKDTNKRKISCGIK